MPDARTLESREPRSTLARAAIAPILRAVGVPFDDDPAIQIQRSANTPEASIVDQLERLAVLHTSGALSDEEFAALKAKIIGAQPV